MTTEYQIKPLRLRDGWNIEVLREAVYVSGRQGLTHWLVFTKPADPIPSQDTTS